VKVDPGTCLRCRATKYLCGLTYCPVTVKMSILNMRAGIYEELSGSSPPSVFVGRFNYPKVAVYPSAPPLGGDTSRYEDPKLWISMSLDEFLAMRLSVFRGGQSFRVEQASDPSRDLWDVQTLALSPRPVEVEMKFKEPPKTRNVIDDTLPPLGPSAPLDKLRLGTIPPPEKVVEKVFSSQDMKAIEGMRLLYTSGVGVERISRILSVGGMGVDRKLVPTRWSITAVDKTLSDQLVKELKEFDILDNVEVYVREHLRNLFVAMLIPGNWSFEWGEAWFPRTAWNYWGGEVAVEIDHEGYSGRKTYPEIGGCYYASRLAVAEHLVKRRRQATVVLWRETYPGFFFPVGVWFVRENVRKLLEGRPETFDTVWEAVEYLSSRLKVSRDWTRKSWILNLMRSRLF
jgi:hypothetical protein